MDTVTSSSEPQEFAHILRGTPLGEPTFFSEDQIQTVSPTSLRGLG